VVAEPLGQPFHLPASSGRPLARERVNAGTAARDADGVRGLRH
jgi:hypothetical protein